MQGFGNDGENWTIPPQSPVVLHSFPSGQLHTSHSASSTCPTFSSGSGLAASHPRTKLITEKSSVVAMALMCRPPSAGYNNHHRNHARYTAFNGLVAAV